MVKVSYASTHYATIQFDYAFDLDLSASDFSLFYLIDHASEQMTHYGFTHADIVDARTGEVLCSLSNED